MTALLPSLLGGTGQTAQSHRCGLDSALCLLTTDVRVREEVHCVSVTHIETPQGRGVFPKERA